MTNYLSPFLFNFNEIIDLDTEMMIPRLRDQKSSEILVPQPRDHEILESIDEDLLSHALKKKQLRKEIRRYEENKKNDSKFLFEITEQHTYEPMFLEIGRPRLKSELILFFLIVRGVWGSISDHAASERIKDSISIRNVLAHYSYDIPGINTIRENLNAVTNETRTLILKCQSLLIIEKGLDDFSRIYIDSTHVSGNTSYPTDVSILYKLLDRAYRSFILLNDFGFPSLDSWIETRQVRMKSHLSFISMNVATQGVKGKVREKFKLMMRMADKLTIDDWDTTNYINARNDRSTVISSMFTLKFRHNFGKLRRRGFEEVHAEQMEKVIAHNFIHMIRKEETAKKLFNFCVH